MALYHPKNRFFLLNNSLRLYVEQTIEEQKNKIRFLGSHKAHIHGTSNLSYFTKCYKLYFCNAVMETSIFFIHPWFSYKDFVLF